MMRKALLFISVAILCLNANAQNIFRIDNNPGHVADFTDFQTAHDDEGVVDGDILYVAGSGTSYGTVTISKSIFVYGPGYFLTSNLGESAEVSPALFGLVTFVASGPDDPSGAMISGLTTGQIDVNASNITIKRNHVTLPIFLNTTGNFSVSNVLIIQNYIIGSSGSGSLGMIHFSGGTVFLKRALLSGIISFKITPLVGMPSRCLQAIPPRLRITSLISEIWASLTASLETIYC